MIDVSQKQGDKHELLLRAAATVFAHRGFTATRISDIAAEAGVGKGTVYEYFRSKDELYFSVCEWINRDIRARVDHHIAAQPGAIARLRAMIREAAAIVVEQRELYPSSLDFWAASRGTSVEHRFTETTNAQYRTYRALIADIIRDGQRSGEIRAEVDATGVATLLVSTFDGLGMQCWLDPTIDAETSAAAFADALCGGLCAGER
jgi:AcrR family transcriptional regulator